LCKKKLTDELLDVHRILPLPVHSSKHWHHRRTNTGSTPSRQTDSLGQAQNLRLRDGCPNFSPIGARVFKRIKKADKALEDKVSTVSVELLIALS
jgi:hypothetical protein